MMVLPLQGGQNVPQLRAADAQLLRQNAFPWETLAVRVGAVLHVGEELGTNGFGLGGLSAHTIHLITMSKWYYH